ncbi:hypothetical protein ABDK56_06950 [Sphingomonas sp. ASV193]|uniref:hypothetical protein n=1 Tax=Sphingomonas sp. ASV193 TaxID=3144405 RepID=UPI0032E8D530
MDRLDPFTTTAVLAVVGAVITYFRIRSASAIRHQRMVKLRHLSETDYRSFDERVAERLRELGKTD